MPFAKLGLHDHIVRSVLAAGYTTPTAIQAQAIPHALTGRDMIGCAQTGTGKTAAFVLPILQRLEQRSPAQRAQRSPAALVLTPTRELAQQILSAARLYSKHTRISSTAIYGGANINPQIRALQHGVDLVIATPGRLMDHMQRKTIDLSHVSVLVLDEADRMLDMGFVRDVRTIVKTLPHSRQTLLFSATMPHEVRALAESILNHPHMIQADNPSRPASTVSHHVYAVGKDQKMALLMNLLESTPMTSVLVFSRTKHGADRIARRLGSHAMAIHSGRSQRQREQALAAFRRAELRVLVATDIAARGIDVQGISHVINFDIPRCAEDYIHRVGRTGRAQASGAAITFVEPSETHDMRRIERAIGTRMQRAA